MTLYGGEPVDPNDHSGRSGPAVPSAHYPHGHPTERPGYPGQPGYPVGAPASAYPPGYPSPYPPGYPPPYPPGFPSPYPPGYPVGAYYPGYPPSGSGRPGALTAAVVLGYVVAGLLIIASFSVFAGASAISDNDNVYRTNSAEYVVAGIVSLIAGGLLITGSVMMTNRNLRGRPIFQIAAVIDLILGIYWMTKDAVFIAWCGLFVAPIVVAVALLGHRAVTGWLRGAPQGPPSVGMPPGY
ncbi:MAG: hypothetical protein JO147_05160 [Actinobacteria bacterium]|nr:hypothetical protein [Actinomycetota bacterium]